MNILYPHRVYNRVIDIPVKFLIDHHIKGVILDIDNTLTTHDNPVPSKGVMEWLEALEAAGIQKIALSNNHVERVEPFARLLKLRYIANGLKPLPVGYLRCLRAMHLSPKYVAVVGDQIFTDILGGRCLGLLSIMVEPIEPEEKPFFQLKRRFERSLMKKYDRRFGR